MSVVPSPAIGDVVDRVTCWAPRFGDSDGAFTYVDLSAVDQDSKTITSPRRLACADAPSRARQIVRFGDVLVSTVRPNLNAVGRVPVELDGATASTGFCVLRPRSQVADGAYLLHWVRSPRFVGEMVRRAKGASYPAVSDRIVRESKIPLPSLGEQKRIAGILDATDALRAKRREALAQLDTLLQSTFLDMFGDPVTNPMGWEERALGELAQNSLRNGLSPSTRGTIDGEVLTLSAITRGRFDFAARKIARFDRQPSSSQKLNTDTFLICRGNGNMKLVGTGAYPDRSSSLVCFPDTMIGVATSPSLMAPAYLQNVWRTRRVRRQIERGARTTNGTHKVNQRVLSSIVFPVPPLGPQLQFAAIAESIRQQEVRQRGHLAKLDTLFASLQSRAFDGEL